MPFYFSQYKLNPFCVFFFLYPHLTPLLFPGYTVNCLHFPIAWHSKDRCIYSYCLSVQLSHSVVSDSLRPHRLQHAKLPCTSPTPRVCSNSCPSNHLILCRSLLLPSIFPSIRVFSKELVLCIRWPKYWSFNSNISPSNKYSGLTSFMIYD